MLRISISCFFLLLFLQPLFSQDPSGGLFIIGGGDRPPELIKAMLTRADLGENGTIVILPLASSEPDSAAWYARKQFLDQAIPSERILVILQENTGFSREALDQIRTATLIYLTGGDQNRFMEIASGTLLAETIRAAYRDGALIAGTSAGAALMSSRMITGNERKHPEYTGEFRTIEADNVELAPGLGLLPTAIIDQHFIQRMRMNRLITVALENPGYHCIGIDESTAVFVRRGFAEVVGVGQVIWLYNSEQARTQNGLLGGRDLSMHVLLPGDKFRIE